MSIKEKAQAVIEVVLSRTREGKARWAPESHWAPPLSGLSLKATSTVFLSQIEAPSGSRFLAAYWRQELPVIALLDGSRTPMWEFPYTTMTGDLVMTASFRGADIEKILDQILQS